MWTNLTLLCLAVVLGFPCYYVLKSDEMDVTLTRDIPRMFPGFVPENIGIIEIQRRKPQAEIEAEKLEGPQQYEGLMFTRTADGWALANTDKAGLAVDPAAVDRDLLDHLVDIRIDRESLVSQEADAEYLRERDLTPESGTVIQCKIGPQGPIAATLILGKSTKKGEQAGAIDAYHVARPDRPREVVLYEPAHKSWHVSLRASDWVHKTIHAFSLSQVESFHYQNEFGSAGFKLKPGSEQTWVAVDAQTSVKDRGAVRQQEVSNLIQEFTKVTAESFGRGKIPIDQNGAKVEVHVRLKTGQEYSVWVQRREADSPNWWTASTESRFLFAWPQFRVSAFRKDPKELFDPQ
jgi:hypothetical protein